MGDVSDIGYPTLAAISENVLRPETLKEANDRVSNAIAELPIFRQYNLGGLLHSSSDGQKFETRIPTINARHSPKYFGLHKGIVSYTLVANHIPVNATIIGANEHESHYVFDLLFNNSTEIQPDVHSTVSLRQGCLNPSSGFVRVAVLILEGRDGHESAWAVAARFVGRTAPVPGVEGTSEAGLPDPAIALGDGHSAGGVPWGQSHVHGAGPRLLRLEETSRRSSRPTAAERSCVPRADSTGPGRQAVPARTR